MMRRSLSAVSSSTELEAVFASTPSFFRRSMTSWLVSFRSRSRVKTLTFPIRRILLGALGPLRCAGRLGRLGLRRRRLGRGFRARGFLLRLALLGLGLLGLGLLGLGLLGLGLFGLGLLRLSLVGLRLLRRGPLRLLGGVVRLPLQTSLR